MGKLNSLNIKISLTSNCFMTLIWFGKIMRKFWSKRIFCGSKNLALTGWPLETVIPNYFMARWSLKDGKIKLRLFKMKMVIGFRSKRSKKSMQLIFIWTFFCVDASDVPFYVSGMFPMIDSDRLLTLGASVSL